MYKKNDGYTFFVLSCWENTLHCSLPGSWDNREERSDQEDRQGEVQSEQGEVWPESESKLYWLLLETQLSFLWQVGLTALDREEKFPSNGSLLGQNSIKFSSEPELGREEGGDREGYVDLQGRGGQSPHHHNQHQILQNYFPFCRFL